MEDTKVIDEECCWICLLNGDDEPLVRSCRCPRSAHRRCIARWQLQKAGQREEKICRFCEHQLPDWRAQLGDIPSSGPRPIMRIELDGESHYIQLPRNACSNHVSIESMIKKAFNIPPTLQLDMSFLCPVPKTGECITLKGIATLPAAWHCAAVNATERGQLERKNLSAMSTAMPPCGAECASDAHTLARSSARTDSNVLVSNGSA